MSTKAERRAKKRASRERRCWLLNQRKWRQRVPLWRDWKYYPAHISLPLQGPEAGQPVDIKQQIARKHAAIAKLGKDLWDDSWREGK